MTRGNFWLSPEKFYGTAAETANLLARNPSKFILCSLNFYELHKTAVVGAVSKILR
jgi:hypothetical protein